MKAKQGQGLSEYVLIGGFVLLASLGALMLLGDTVNSLFGNFAGSLISSKGSAPASAASGNGGGPAPVVSNNTTTPPAPVNTPSQTSAGPQMTASYDPSSGLIVLEGLDVGASGRTTTGSQGSEAASQALLLLAQTATKDDGTPIDSNVQDLLTRLANLGHNLSTAEAPLESYPRPDLSDPNYKQSSTYKAYYDSGITGLVQEFNPTYDQLIAAIGNDPQYSTLLSQANDYIGIISSISVVNFMGQFKPTAVSADGTVSTFTPTSGMIAGTNISTTPLTVNLTTATTTATAPTTSTSTQTSTAANELLKTAKKLR